MVARFFARIAIGIAMVLVALVAAFVAIGFFCFAIYLLLVEFLIPPVAAVATGVSVLVIAMLLVLAAKSAVAPKRKGRRKDDPSLEACESAAEMGSVLGRKLMGLAEAHGSGSLWAALVAGFAIGISPKLRKFLTDILKI